MDSLIMIDEQGEYIVQAFLECDTLTDTVNVAINGFTFSLGDDLSSCYDNSVTIRGPYGYAACEWNNGNTNPEVTVTDTGIYILTIVDTAGCDWVDSVEVNNDQCGCGVFIPNALTVNN